MTIEEINTRISELETRAEGLRSADHTKEAAHEYCKMIVEKAKLQGRKELMESLH